MAKSDYVSADDRRQRLARLAAEVPALLKLELEKVRNLDLTILKCHMLIEYMLNQFIDLTARTEDALYDSRFSFHQELCLAHMLGLPADPLLMPSLELLNTIRNSVAHTLVPNRALIDEPVRWHSEASKEVQNLSDAQRVTALKRITRGYCGRVLGMIEGQHAVEMLSESDRKTASPDRSDRLI
jgi:hypothetical protein